MGKNRNTIPDTIPAQDLKKWARAAAHEHDHDLARFQARCGAKARELDAARRDRN